MGLSVLPEFTHWLPRRLRIYSHRDILRHNHSVHSIDCNNKLAPFRDCTFYYQQNKTKKEILPEFDNIHHPWVLCVVLRLISVWFPKRPVWFCCGVTCPCQGCDKCTSTTVFGQTKCFLDGAVAWIHGQPHPEEHSANVLALSWSQGGLQWGESSEGAL